MHKTIRRGNMSIKRISGHIILVLVLALTFSISGFAQEQDEVYEIGNTVEPRAEVWTTINTTSGTIGVPVNTYVPGASSYYVRLAQATLNALNYNCGTADGVYGTNTKNAIINFQRAEGITADGIVGQNTWNRMSFYTFQQNITVPF